MAADGDYNDFVSAIDNHNVANGDASWFERKVDATKEFAGDVGEALTKGAVGAVVAGTDSILNSGIAVANLLGADVEPINTHHVLESLDSDLGDYYEQHSEGIETAGFAVGMFIPGTAGLKAAQAAKAGFLGSNMVKASGLMRSLTYDYAAAAKAEAASGTAPFSIINGNTLKALAQGFGSGIVEMGAFNTAVAATMFASPTMDRESIGDVVWNDIKESVLFGGVSGLIKGFELYGGITKAGKAVDQIAFPYRLISKVPEDAGPELKIIQLYKDKMELPEAMGPFPDISKATGLVEGEVSELVTREREKTVDRINELIKGNLNKLAGGDTDAAEKVNQGLDQATSVDQVANALLGTKQIQRIGAAESIAPDEIYYPRQGLSVDEYTTHTNNKAYDQLLTSKGGEGSTGYVVTGNLADLKTATSNDAGYIGSGAKQVAFDSGVDLFRNSNGTVSVNPSSKILTSTALKPSAKNVIVDLENNNSIVSKATAGLAEFATKDSPVTVKGDVVMAGNMKPITIGSSLTYNPLTDPVLSAQARYIWAQSAKINFNGLKIGENDLPLLERIYAEGPKLDGVRDILIKTEDGKFVPAPRGQSLLNYIENKKANLAQAMNGKPIDEIGLRINADDKWITGEGGDSIKINKDTNINSPRYIKLVQNEEALTYPAMNAINHTGMLEYMRQVDLIKNRHIQNFNAIAGDMADQFPDEMKWTDPGRTPTREGSGASLFGFANNNFSTPGGWAQFVGTLTDRMMLGRKTETAKSLNNSFAALAQKGPAAIAEAALINNRLLQSPEAWKFHPNNPLALVPRKDFAALASGKMAVADDIINIQNEEVADYFRIHSDINGGRQQHVSNMKGAAGVGDDFDPTTIYPVPVDTTKLKHFVLVEPRAPVTLSDKKRIIAAKDQSTLSALINNVDQDQFRVYTKQESEDWHKAIGDYDFSLGLNESSVDSSLKRKGVLSQHFPTIDEGFLDRVMDWHMRQEEVLTHSAVYHRYAQSFEELKELGKRYTNLSTSQFRSLTERLENTVQDPYNNIVKTALNISNAAESPRWTNFNNTIRDAIETPVNKLRDIFASSKDIDQNFVDNVTSTMKDMGQAPVFSNAMDIMMANKNVPNKPWLQRYVAKANSLISTTLLQWDVFNGINNAVSSSIITAPEMAKLIQGIKEANPDVAGKLSSLMSVTAPDGSGIVLPTASRLLYNAHTNFIAQNELTKGLVERYQKIGAINSLAQEMRQAIDNLTLNYNIAKEGDGTNALTKMAEFGRKWTGNTLAEQYTRFIAADMARQISDYGVEAGILTTHDQDQLINIFTNRTQGNYLYSQRPIVFQGVVGQAIGLFQTYQFNMMQQLFKHVQDGQGKFSAMSLALQGGIYGTQGLPAFNFINNHIIGNAAGNTDHSDLYTGTYNVLGKTMGDWMLYGIGSNALGIVDPSMKFNLYSRGDINPRQLTVLPTQISDIPIVAASTKFVGNIFGALGKISQGADIIPTVSQAIEHNGLSRPLAGLAQLVQGYSTTNSGSLLTASQDFYNIATLTRLAGGKPFDESLALDSLYRINAYRAADQKNIQELGSAVKTTVIAGGHPTDQMITNFAAEYAKSGGKIENFNRYFSSLMMDANRSQVNKIAQNLQSPYAKQLQLTMGGVPLPDFTSKGSMIPAANP